MASYEVPAYGLIRDLIEQTVSRSDAEMRAASIRMKIPDKAYLLVLEYEERKLGLTIYMLHKTICSALPMDTVIIYRDRIVALIDHGRLNRPTVQMLHKMIADLPIQGGISRNITDMLELRRAYDQARAAVHIGRKNSLEQICLYDDIALLHLLETTARNVDIKSFCSPAIEKLEKYDAEHDVSMLQTLEAYLECGRNMQASAERLFIHRSSMHTRLRKIEEIADIDLHTEQTCFYLQLSLRIRKIIL